MGVGSRRRGFVWADFAANVACEKTFRHLKLSQLNIFAAYLDCLKCVAKYPCMVMHDCSVVIHRVNVIKETRHNTITLQH